ncbi:MAG: hypothetical protein E5V60_13075 [Mesorhizobium sp.]|nr:MAG: hypothetical protein E5V60_13075 [Mesorhizobium sp.]
MTQDRRKMNCDSGMAEIVTLMIASAMESVRPVKIMAATAMPTLSAFGAISLIDIFASPVSCAEATEPRTFQQF